MKNRLDSLCRFSAVKEENQDDLMDVPEETRQSLHIVPVHWVSDVLKQTGILTQEK
ncbi:MAG TPA: hypothetical protein H9934_11490 [Candidatus Anaerobutyricum faecale]|nr:hypothetical protein [Candidatus Anaerobutyricum faecale]